MARVGGRPRRIDVADIVRAGREIGLRDLSLNGVAERLGVTSAALYRHVDGRWGLERLVGESLLAELRIEDDPELDPARHLLSVGLQLRAGMLDRPGLAAYVLTLFPRGEGGMRLLADGTESLVRRGYEPAAGMVLCSAVAGVAVGYAAGEDARDARADGIAAQRRETEAAMAQHPRLGPAVRTLPHVEPDEYVRLWLGATVQAFVTAAPPGRPVDEIRAALRAAGGTG